MGQTLAEEHSSHLCWPGLCPFELFQMSLLPAECPDREKKVGIFFFFFQPVLSQTFLSLSFTFKIYSLTQMFCCGNFFS